jgi:DNA topoisomerase-2
MQYQELDLHEHTLKRPDTYVGSIRKHKDMEYVVNMDEKDISIEKREIEYTPAMLRIFVEVLSNSVDNVSRSKQFNVPCKSIKINIDEKTGETTVWNDGLSIPIKHHEQSDTWIPDMLFGRLLTSSNYDDTEERTTSGRNGLGVSLTNIFSKSFKIKLMDPTTGQTYSQKWDTNMKNRGKPRINKSKSSKGYTEVSWVPDFEYFGYSKDGYSNDFVSLLYRYVVDAAMVVSNDNVSVFLNGKKLPIKKFRDYVKMYKTDNPKEIMVLSYERSECIITSSSGPDTISFVNGVFTKKGGVHVDGWTDKIFKTLSQKINSKHKNLKLTSRDMRQYFRVFVNCTIPNPEFATQSKNKLVSPKIKVDVDVKKITPLLKWDFMEDIRKMIKMKEMMTLKKSERKRGHKKIEGFDPANKAGGKCSSQCTLILCEGLSAKTYAVLGIQQGSWFGDKLLKGRDWYGVMALRGKVLNVRKSTPSSISNNKEIVNIIQALGLQHGMDYSIDKNFETLRYGRVMLLTDQDVDGYHIMGLIINMFDYLFPTLLERQGFITCMHTPIMKIQYKNEDLRFYNLETAKKFIEKKGGKMNIKYYKGLGTSSDKDVKETFGKRVILYNTDDNSKKNIDRIFNKDDSDFRKNWMSEYKHEDIEPCKYDEHLYSMDISSFINNDFIQFSIDDCKRSIPHMIDGLKESNRKILYACILKNLQKPIKVAQLAGFVAEKTNYHHGEGCLFDTITNMAQDFVGSNNIPLLEKEGQFGSRLYGGKDAASARYIFTKCSTLTRSIFKKDDDDILTYINDDGDMIEPEYYLPIIPMILVNGGNGIGTGWSSFIPCYNPLDIIEWIENWLNKKSIWELTPWYNGFTGEIKKTSTDRFQTTGVMSRTGNKIKITELPIGVWTDKYKEFLEDLLEKRMIKSMNNYSTPDKVHFEITEMKDNKLTPTKLKLSNIISTSNLVLFNENNNITKYHSINHILTSFCNIRLSHYDRRKDFIYDKLMKEYKFIKNKLRFLKLVMDDTIVIHKRDEEDIKKDMKKNKITDDHDYLLSLPIKSFSKQKINKLMEQKDDIKSKIEYIKNKTPSDIWLDDLTELKSKLKK